PSQIDPDSGYRLYGIDQLTDIIRIQALKDCGFALEEITLLMHTHDDSTIQSLLKQRIAAQQQIVVEEQARLQRIVARLHLLEVSGATYAVATKRSEPITLVGMRRIVAAPSDIGPFACTVVSELAAREVAFAGLLIHLYYEGMEEGFDLFVGAPVTVLPLESADLLCERLAGGELMASVIYRGDYAGISQAYAALDRWLATSGYHAGGPYREIYHRSPAHVDDPAEYITEIQCPVAESCSLQTGERPYDDSDGAL
ncbi:MAG TPA: GyrI-like domain-containing protein, partial [Ktedonobacterales bacterium]|nr:GyrI-like domain-containing protein [Ktedonobacterales bacterium]